MKRPTRREMLERAKRLSPHLQRVVRAALTKAKEETSASHSQAPAGRTDPAPGPSDSTWPGYVWFLENAPRHVVEDIAVRGNYYRLGEKERQTIRARLGWSVRDVIEARDLLHYAGREPA